MNEGTGTAADRLARLGLQLPPPPVPVAAFEPYVRHGSTIYLWKERDVEKAVEYVLLGQDGDLPPFD